MRVNEREPLGRFKPGSDDLTQKSSDAQAQEEELSLREARLLYGKTNYEEIARKNAHARSEVMRSVFHWCVIFPIILLTILVCVGIFMVGWQYLTPISDHFLANWQIQKIISTLSSGVTAIVLQSGLKKFYENLTGKRS